MWERMLKKSLYERITPMKIIAVLEEKITSGGGFNQATNAILQMQRICEGRFSFEVFTTHPENLQYLKRLGLTAHVFTNLLINRLVTKLNTSRWWQITQSHYSVFSPLEKKLLNHGCDLVYFVTPGGTSRSLQKLNYIATIWDLCHLEAPIFPEVRESNEFFKREHYFRNNLGPAVIILTDSNQLARVASFRYGVSPVRFLPMPFAPSPFLEHEHALSKDDVLKKHNLKEGYYYYPAQFWAHKNHIRILEALLLLNSNDLKSRVVFSGKDYGNRKYLEDFVYEHSLQEQVSFLGFVPIEDMRGLYEGSLAVVMPTYFGPTNLPPLEAWSLGKPLIYSAHLEEQAGNAALLINPDNPNEIAEAMVRCNDSAIRWQLIEAGKHRLNYFANQRAIAEKDLLGRLEQFAAQRRCWR